MSTISSHLCKLGIWHINKVFIIIIIIININNIVINIIIIMYNCVEIMLKLNLFCRRLPVSR